MTGLQAEPGTHHCLPLWLCSLDAIADAALCQRVDGDPSLHGGVRKLQPGVVLMALMDPTAASHSYFSIDKGCVSDRRTQTARETG